ncbi:DUF4274 domain-containing protein [Bacillus sp. RAR_GA_16]|uniref:DUF4274 domain-containing protein n=1 Tax=Bacillus sp. RAR_GA_16 TaxID=2876774 RepID=UPI001CCB0809|nr:DUF4274 domain-containing protein [Bacillus sp. RAR_GA_16]MCA0172895.1 DUF4274 domain-containing protein [Bacillus sp. RAR_GA_16]
MDKSEVSLLKHFLYDDEKDKAKQYLTKTTDSLFLHYFAMNYNWDQGFDLPSVILENKACDFGTGLCMFHSSDGIRLLISPEEVSQSSLEGWKVFVNKVAQKLIDEGFVLKNISYEPDITKVQRYKLRKSKIPDILIEPSPGERVQVLMI